MPSQPTLSFVIPAMNEAESIGELHRQIDVMCRAEGLSFEILFIDDGSTDATWEGMRTLAERHGEVRAIRLRRNFGKAAALSAGFEAACGDVVVTMDADLQDDPKEVPRMIGMLGPDALQADALDVVSGWKQVRHDPWHKTLPSKVFNWLVSSTTGVRLHDHNCGFKAYRREVTQDVTLYGERHRFVPVLAAAQGYRVGEMVVEHHPRRHGQSKYGVSRLVKGFLDLLTVRLITGYGKRPLHLIGSLGLIVLVTGLIGIAYLSAMWVLTRLVDGWDVLHLHETAVFYYCILATLLGAQFVLAGLLAELFVAATLRPGSHYNVREVVNGRAVTEPESPATVS